MRWLIGVVVLALSIVVVVTYSATATTQRVPTVGYDQFIKNLGQVSSVTTEGSTIEWKSKSQLSPTNVSHPATTFRSTVPSFGDPNLETALLSRNIRINQGAPPRYSWDVVVSATPFSQLAAILAGFALVAMVAIVTLKPRGEENRRRTRLREVDKLKPLLSAFLTLTVAAFLFAVLSGSPTTGGQSIDQLLAANIVDWVFALGVLQVSVGITWMLFHYSEQTAFTTTRWIVHAAVAVLALSLSGVAVQPLFIQFPDNLVANGVTWGLSAAIVLAALFIGMCRWQRTSSEQSLHQLNWVTPIAVIVVVGGVLLFGSTSAFSGTEYSSPRALVFGLPIIAPLALAFFVLMYEATLPNPDRDHKMRAGQETARAAPHWA